jgi:2,3-bisphosphoglycerate-independent phosphoglycerate mutase
MKYALIIPDGCADEPQESLGGKTPLQAANVPNMDAVARQGLVGRASNVPESLPAGSDVATLSLLGFDPLRYYTGRAPLEAAAMGIGLGPYDWAVRCNLVTVIDDVMVDFTAGHISSDEARQLIEAVQHDMGDAAIHFHAGVSYRHIMIFRAFAGNPPFTAETVTVPPHDLTDQSVIGQYPSGPGGDLLYDLMHGSRELFSDHPINRARREQGKRPATMIWLWGQGGAPQLPTFRDRFGIEGAMITAVDLLRGLANLLDWDVVDVPGATGYLDTDYAAKGQAGIAALERADFVTVHVEATDEASHEGDAAKKIEALEQIDKHIVGPMAEALAQYPEARLLVSPDHRTLLRTKTHSHGYVPFALMGTGIAAAGESCYDESTAARSNLVFDEGPDLMPFFLGKQGPNG